MRYQSDASSQTQNIHFAFHIMFLRRIRSTQSPFYTSDMKRLNPPWKELSNDVRNSISRFLEPEIGFRPCELPAIFSTEKFRLEDLPNGEFPAKEEGKDFSFSISGNVLIPTGVSCEKIPLNGDLIR